MDKAQLDKLVIGKGILGGFKRCYLFPELGYLILQGLDGLLDCLDYEILELSIGQGDERFKTGFG
jgi:hypothetical protein